MLGTLVVFGVGAGAGPGGCAGDRPGPGPGGKGSGRMRLDGRGGGRGVGGPLARVDPRVKLVATVGYVVAVVLTPPGAWRVLAAEGLLLALVVGWAGVEPGPWSGAGWGSPPWSASWP